MFHRKITVFCAASNRINKIYPETAFDLGKLLAQSGREIIFGAGNIGSMNSLANGALSAKGLITGVIPEFMHVLKLTHNEISKLIVVDDMHQRESIMLRQADAIIALPGGSGTFSELLQAITWKQLGLIICPIIIINVNNYFEPLLAMLNKAIHDDFMRIEYKALWKVCTTPEQAIALLN